MTDSTDKNVNSENQDKSESQKKSKSQEKESFIEKVSDKIDNFLKSSPIDLKLDNRMEYETNKDDDEMTF